TQPATGETYPKSDLFNKAANILNLQKLINISHQLEITPVSDDSKPEILQLLNSVKEHIAELDQEIAVFCQKND
ncbi:hypothetical protein LIY96_19190, partial [Escherichia coli]|nr:hypothetical protein [Escherichia coli]